MYRQLLSLVLAGLTFGSGAHAATPANTAASASPAASAPASDLQEWELRRKGFLQTIKRLHENDKLARRDFERQVRSFEQLPFSLTPLEAMDYLGAVFVPQAGAEKLLPLVAAQAALGLYDVLRFGSILGEAQLLDGEQFLNRPFSLGGPDQVEKARAFMRANPERTAQLVQEGLSLANGERIGPSYDTRWVRALGRCAPEIAATCPPLRDVPLADWDEVWVQVKQHVANYYRVKPKAPPVPASAPASAAR